MSVKCPRDNRELKIHKKRSGIYWYVSCVCGYVEKGITEEELRKKVNQRKREVL